MRLKAESLEDLCVKSAIDNLDLLSDVGHTDARLLHIILPHCTAEQLMHIENSTTSRDLSQITNELWLKCYTRKFGADNVKLVTDRMKKRNMSFKWKTLYQAKLREQDEVQKKCVSRLRELYVEADNQKQSKQIKQIDLHPPVSKRKQWSSGSGGGGGGGRGCLGMSADRTNNPKGRLMKKARMEFAASNEAKRRAAVRNKPTFPARRK